MKEKSKKKKDGTTSSYQTFYKLKLHIQLISNSIMDSLQVPEDLFLQHACPRIIKAGGAWIIVCFTMQKLQILFFFFSIFVG